MPPRYSHRTPAPAHPPGDPRRPPSAGLGHVYYNSDGKQKKEVEDLQTKLSLKNKSLFMAQSEIERLHRQLRVRGDILQKTRESNVELSQRLQQVTELVGVENLPQEVLLPVNAASMGTKPTVEDGDVNRLLLETDLERKTQYIHQLETKASELKNENELLGKIVSELKTKNESLESDNMNLRGNIASDEKKIEVMTSGVDRIKKNKQEVEAALLDINDELEEFKKEIGAREGAVAEVRAALDQLQECVKECLEGKGGSDRGKVIFNHNLYDVGNKPLRRSKLADLVVGLKDSEMMKEVVATMKESNLIISQLRMSDKVMNERLREQHLRMEAKQQLIEDLENELAKKQQPMFRSEVENRLLEKNNKLEDDFLKAHRRVDALQKEVEIHKMEAYEHKTQTGRLNESITLMEDKHKLDMKDVRSRLERLRGEHKAEVENLHQAQREKQSLLADLRKSKEKETELEKNVAELKAELRYTKGKVSEQTQEVRFAIAKEAVSGMAEQERLEGPKESYVNMILHNELKEERASNAAMKEEIAALKKDLSEQQQRAEQDSIKLIEALRAQEGEHGRVVALEELRILDMRELENLKVAVQLLEEEVERLQKEDGETGSD